MKTMIAVMVAAVSLMGSTLAMARPYHVDSGWGPPTGTLRVQYGGGYTTRAIFTSQTVRRPEIGSSEAGFRVVREP